MLNAQFFYMNIKQTSTLNNPSILTIIKKIHFNIQIIYKKDSCVPSTFMIDGMVTFDESSPSPSVCRRFVKTTFSIDSTTIRRSSENQKNLELYNLRSEESKVTFRTQFLFDRWVIIQNSSTNSFFRNDHRCDSTWKYSKIRTEYYIL